MAGLAMATAAEADNFHSSSQRSGYPMNTIFDHEAFSGRDAEFPSGKEEEIGRRFSASDDRRAEHMGIEELADVGHLKGVAQCDYSRRLIPEQCVSGSIRRYHRWLAILV